MTQSCKTGLESNSYADGRPSSVLNAIRDSLIDDNWDFVSIHNASCSLERVIIPIELLLKTSSQLFE